MVSTYALIFRCARSDESWTYRVDSKGAKKTSVATNFGSEAATSIQANRIDRVPIRELIWINSMQTYIKYSSHNDRCHRQVDLRIPLAHKAVLLEAKAHLWAGPRSRSDLGALAASICGGRATLRCARQTLVPTFTGAKVTHYCPRFANQPLRLLRRYQLRNADQTRGLDGKDRCPRRLARKHTVQS